MRVNSTETNDNEFTEAVQPLRVTQTWCVTGSLTEAGSVLTSEAWCCQGLGGHLAGLSLLLHDQKVHLGVASRLSSR